MLGLQIGGQRQETGPTDWRSREETGTLKNPQTGEQVTTEGRNGIDGEQHTCSPAAASRGPGAAVPTSQRP